MCPNCFCLVANRCDACVSMTSWIYVSACMLLPLMVLPSVFIVVPIFLTMLVAPAIQMGFGPCDPSSGPTRLPTAQLGELNCYTEACEPLDGMVTDTPKGDDTKCTMGNTVGTTAKRRVEHAPMTADRQRCAILPHGFRWMLRAVSHHECRCAEQRKQRMSP